MCRTCTTHADRIASGELTAAQADRLRTAIKMCERYADQPKTPVRVISDELLNAISDEHFNHPTR